MEKNALMIYRICPKRNRYSLFFTLCRTSSMYSLSLSPDNHRYSAIICKTNFFDNFRSPTWFFHRVILLKIELCRSVTAGNRRRSSPRQGKVSKADVKHFLERHAKGLKHQ
jgi:hypothetical protein